MASSWGSVLGVHMVKARPELFAAYVGTAQLVSYREDQRAAYDALMSLARAGGDAETVAALEGVGPPPWTNPRHPGLLRRLTRRYEAKTTTPAPKAWWVPAPEFATPEQEADREGSDDYSYLQYTGYKGDGFGTRVDLNALGTAFELPVFLIQGTEDLVTPPAVTQRYFDRVTAPEKALVLCRGPGTTRTRRWWRRSTGCCASGFAVGRAADS